jgi:hypothetical protein
VVIQSFGTLDCFVPRNDGYEIRFIIEFFWFRNPLDHRVEYGFDIESCLRTHWDDIFFFASEEAHHLFTDTIRVCTWEVDFIEYWDDGEIIFYREIDVREGLCLDPLTCIDDEDRSLDGRERAGDLVLEVDVSWSIDEVELDSLPLHTDWCELDRDTTLTLEIHIIEGLGLDFSFFERACDLHESVGKSRLPMIDVGNDTEVAD